MENRQESICEICTNGDDSLQVCRICRSKVCGECFIESAGICASCEEAQCSICGEYLSARACNSCGRLVCEDHGTKVGEATICDICKEKKQ